MRFACTATLPRGSRSRSRRRESSARSACICSKTVAPGGGRTPPTTTFPTSPPAWQPTTVMERRDRTSALLRSGRLAGSAACGGYGADYGAFASRKRDPYADVRSWLMSRDAVPERSHDPATGSTWRLSRRDGSYYRADMWADNETRVDLLGFDFLVDELLVVLRDPRLLPITVGVAGDWGSGKSSLLGMTELALANEKVLTVSFSPWRFEDYEDVKTALMAAVIGALQD